MVSAKPAPKKRGTAAIFTFPFWICVDHRCEFRICDATVGDSLIRVYPPFRSAPLNYSATPTVNSRAIPYLEEVSTRPSLEFIELGWIPTFPIDGGPGMVAYWSKEWKTLPNIIPMDSIRIDVLGIPYHHQSHNIVRRILRRLRHLTHQWWILRTVSSLNGYERATFEIDDMGAPLAQPGSTQAVHIPFGFELPIDDRTWGAAVEDAFKNTEAPPYESAVLDAYFCLASSDVSASIISAAIGCEQATESAFEQIWLDRNPGRRFRRGSVMSGWALPNHLSQDLQTLCARSFQDEHPQDFALISELWDLRGRVAHGHSITVTKQRIEDILAASRRLLIWLAALKK